MNMQIASQVLQLDDAGKTSLQCRLDLPIVLPHLRRNVLQTQGSVNVLLPLIEQILAISQARQRVLTQGITATKSKLAHSHIMIL